MTTTTDSTTDAADVEHEPRETKGARTRQAILDAAIARFGRDGYRSTSIADVARDASVGSTVPYTYFPNKEALFLAALDTDTSAALHEGLVSVIDDPTVADWRRTMIFTLAAAMERHPLTHRVLAGQEPGLTTRVLTIPALTDLREACIQRLRTEQAAGAVRPDIDPVTIGNGVIAIVISLLRSVVELGPDLSTPYADDVFAVFAAALDPIAPRI